MALMTHTAETIPEVDEAIAHLRRALDNAEGERADILREFLDNALDRRLELMAEDA